MSRRQINAACSAVGRWPFVAGMARAPAAIKASLMRMITLRQQQQQPQQRETQAVAIAIPMT